MSFVACEWDYLNEGGQNIILYYLGKKENLKGKVLRIAKEIIFKTQYLIQHIKFTFSKEQMRLELTKNLYIKNLGESLIQSEIVNYLLIKYKFIFQIINFNNEQKQTFLQEIEKNIQNKRHLFRQSSKINYSCNLMIEEDYSLNYFSQFQLQLFEKQQIALLNFEIKPKSSLKQKYSDRISVSLKHNNNLQQLFENSIYNLKFGKVQLFKLKNKKINSISSYNPYNFFEQNSMNKAISNLFDSPNNNFSFTLDNNYLDIQQQNLIKIIKKICKLKYPIIQAILNLQKLFDYNTQIAKKALILYQKYISDQVFIDFSKHLDEIFHQYSQEKMAKNIESIIQMEASPKNSLSCQEIESLIQIILAFLISFTWRDISIIVKCVILSRNYEETNQFSVITDNFTDFFEYQNLLIHYKFGIIDTQLKSINKILEIVEQDKSLILMFNSLLNQYSNEIFNLSQQST